MKFDSFEDALEEIILSETGNILFNFDITDDNLTQSDIELIKEAQKINSSLFMYQYFKIYKDIKEWL